MELFDVFPKRRKSDPFSSSVCSEGGGYLTTDHWGIIQICANIPGNIFSIFLLQGTTITHTLGITQPELEVATRFANIGYNLMIFYIKALQPKFFVRSKIKSTG